MYDCIYLEYMHKCDICEKDMENEIVLNTHYLFVHYVLKSPCSNFTAIDAENKRLNMVERIKILEKYKYFTQADRFEYLQLVYEVNSTYSKKYIPKSFTSLEGINMCINPLKIKFGIMKYRRNFLHHLFFRSDHHSERGGYYRFRCRTCDKEFCGRKLSSVQTDMINHARRHGVEMPPLGDGFIYPDTSGRTGEELKLY